MGKKLTHKIYIALLLLIVLVVFGGADDRAPRWKSDNHTIFQNEKLAVLQTGSIDRLQPAYVKEGVLYASEDHFVFRHETSKKEFTPAGRLGKVDPSFSTWLKDKVARRNIVRRFRRNPGPADAIVLKSGTILVFYDLIYRSEDGSHFQAVFDFKPDFYRPFSHGISVDDHDNIYIGEYNCTLRPHTIRILKGTDDGKSWNVCHSFKAGEIFHVHSLTYDRFRNRLWICAGDTDDESGIYFTDDDFKTMTKLGGGDQEWRACSLMVQKNYLYWCSDNDRDGSKVCRWDFANQRREIVQDIGKPSYFSTVLQDGTLVFSTTYEPDSDFTRDFRPKPSTEIWVSKAGSDWHRILELGYKQGTTPYGSSRATIIFPSGDQSAEFLYFTPYNTENKKFTLQRCQISWKQLAVAEAGN